MRLLACLWALSLAGCVSLAPPYQAPLLPVAGAYPGTNSGADSGADSGQGNDAAALAWRDYFADPRLQAMIALALEQNRDLRIAALRVEEARAAYGIARADQFPTLGLGVDGSRTRVPADLNLTRQPLLSYQYQVGLAVSAWELDFWGRVRSLKDAALENMLAGDAARRAVTLMLVAQVADGYLMLREMDERILLARASVASRAESLRIFTRRFEVGSTSKLDLMQVATLLTQAEALAAQLEQGRALRAHALVQLVGAPLELAPGPGGLAAGQIAQDRLADGSLSDTLVLRPLRAGLPSDLLLARPDILAAEHQLRAAHANIGAARAAFFPRIALTSSLGSASAELGGLFESGSRAWSLVPRLTLPIFDAGRNQAALDLAGVRREIAVANYEKTVQSAFREVADALSARQWLSEQVHVARRALAAQSERARLAKLRYDNGAAPYLEVLDAQRDLLIAEQQLVQVRRALLSSQVSLYAALGGGTKDVALGGAKDVALGGTKDVALGGAKDAAQDAALGAVRNPGVVVTH